MMKVPFEILVKNAVHGDIAALEKVIENIQQKIYTMAFKMLYDPDDAADATQEILIKVITHLSGFRAECAFLTWVYKISANYLLATRKRKIERQAESFEEYENKLDMETGKAWKELESSAQSRLAVEEIRISCLQGMLLSLNREHRLAFILVHVLDLDNALSADILNISHSAFRKRISRARAKLCGFMTKNCRLINPNNRCQCERIAYREVHRGNIDFQRLSFADHSCKVKYQDETSNRLEQLDELRRIGFQYKQHTTFLPPIRILVNVKQLIASDKFEMLQ